MGATPTQVPSPHNEADLHTRCCWHQTPRRTRRQGTECTQSALAASTCQQDTLPSTTSWSGPAGCRSVQRDTASSCWCCRGCTAPPGTCCQKATTNPLSTRSPVQQHTGRRKSCWRRPSWRRTDPRGTRSALHTTAKHSRPTHITHRLHHSDVCPHVTLGRRVKCGPMQNNTHRASKGNTRVRQRTTAMSVQPKSRERPSSPTQFCANTMQRRQDWKACTPRTRARQAEGTWIAFVAVPPAGVGVVPAEAWRTRCHAVVRVCGPSRAWRAKVVRGVAVVVVARLALLAAVTVPVLIIPRRTTRSSLHACRNQGRTEQSTAATHANQRETTQPNDVAIVTSTVGEIASPLTPIPSVHPSPAPLRTMQRRQKCHCCCYCEGKGRQWRAALEMATLSDHADSGPQTNTKPQP